MLDDMILDIGKNTYFPPGWGGSSANVLKSMFTLCPWLKPWIAAVTCYCDKK